VVSVLAIAGVVLALATTAHASPVFGPKDYVVQPGLPLPAIERFPACEPERGGQLRVENGPGGRPRVTLAVLVLNQRETVLMLEGPGQPLVRKRPVQLGANNTMLVWMIGPPGATLAVSVTSAGACLDVAITSPAAGASVPEGPLLVRGTVRAPGPSGVSVNGFPAMTHGDHWAVEVPVDPSVGLLTAIATVVGGESTTTSIPITITSASPASIELLADPPDGILPHVVTWKVVNNTGRAIIQYELDRIGSGAFEPPTPSLDGNQATYSTAGIWFPTLRATDDQGVTYTASTVVLANDPVTVSARFEALWTGFKARLKAGDTTGALSFLSPILQPRMEVVFQQLGADLPTVVRSFGSLHVTGQLGDLAEAVLVQDEPAGPHLYFIQFRRDSLGRWLIEEM
jgi:hypothetical protein